MRNPKQREAIAKRLTLCLDEVEQSWAGRPIGIGYDCDTDTGRITLRFGPADAPEHTVTLNVDVEDVQVGRGSVN